MKNYYKVFEVVYERINGRLERILREPPQFELQVEFDFKEEAVKHIEKYGLTAQEYTILRINQP